MNVKNVLDNFYTEPKSPRYHLSTSYKKNLIEPNDVEVWYSPKWWVVSAFKANLTRQFSATMSIVSITTFV